MRVAIFPRNTHARLRYVPLSPQTLGHTREEALTRNLWTCRTSFMRTEVVRVKHSWESNWSYYEIKIAVPIIPGFGRSNAALLPLRECPEFTGEVVVMRRTGPRLTRVADMRLEDRRKVEIAIISSDIIHLPSLFVMLTLTTALSGRRWAWMRGTAVTS